MSITSRGVYCVRPDLTQGIVEMPINGFMVPHPYTQVTSDVLPMNRDRAQLMHTALAPIRRSQWVFATRSRASGPRRSVGGLPALRRPRPRLSLSDRWCRRASPSPQYPLLHGGGYFHAQFTDSILRAFQPCTQPTLPGLP